MAKDKYKIVNKLLKLTEEDEQDDAEDEEFVVVNKLYPKKKKKKNALREMVKVEQDQ